jgi:uncharacterized membrane protein SpoIIM required for sporulation
MAHPPVPPALQESHEIRARRLRLRDEEAARQRFERLLDRSEQRRLGPIGFDELRELGRLYRNHAAQLARKRERGDDPESIRHLNALCVRAYTFLYAGPIAWRRATAADVGRLLSRCWPAIAAAWVLLFLGMLVGAALVRQDPASIHAFIPPSLGYDPELVDRLATSADAREAFLQRVDATTTERTIFGSTLFAHNTRVGLLSFAAGVLGGVPTALLQLYNGIVIGAFTSVFLSDPWPVTYLAWLLPHAIPELTAISLCAAAGLLLGAAVVAPGRHGRPQALRSALAPTLLLVASAVPLFFAAAFVESFVRESDLGSSARLSIAILFLSLIGGAVLATRRTAKHRGVSPAWLADLTVPARTASADSDRGHEH